MSGIFAKYQGRNVKITLKDGKEVFGRAILCISADDDSEGVEYDSIQLKFDGKKESIYDRSIFFSDEIESIEIIEP